MDVLTDRQRRLLMLLMTAHDWLTSEQLAERLGVSSKLVKQEIAAIRRTAGASCAIQSSTRRGYRLARLAAGLRHELVQEFDVHEGHHSITHRYARLFVYLLCADGPVSSAQLARLFLCSKTSIAEELEIARYRVERMGALSFVTHARRGVQVTGPEVELRYEAAKWLQASFLEGIPFDSAARAELAELIGRLDQVARQELAPLAAAGRISGEDVARVGRYLAISVWRSQGGHRCTPVVDTGVAPAAAPVPAEVAAQAATSTGAMVERLVDAVATTCGCHLDAAEQRGLAQLLADTVQPVTPSPAARAAAERLVAFVDAELGARAAALVAARGAALARQLAVMGERVRAGHGALNYQASATMARYPLEGYLALRFVAQEHGAFTTAKAEAARLALELAAALAPLHAQHTAVLYSDESMAVVHHLVACLKQAFGACIAHVHTMPVAAAADEAADVAFTTDAAFSAAHPDVLLIPVLPTASELAALRPAVDDALARVRDMQQAAVWRELPADAAATARVTRVFDELGAHNAFAGEVDGARVVLLTVVRTAVIIWHDADSAVQTDLPTTGTMAVRAFAPGLRFRGKRFDRVVEWVMPPAGPRAARSTFACLAWALRESVSERNQARSPK